jgi:hypothetical protein
MKQAILASAFSDLAKQISIDPRDDLAQQPRGIAIGSSVSCPGAVLALLLGNGLAYPPPPGPQKQQGLADAALLTF